MRPMLEEILTPQRRERLEGYFEFDDQWPLVIYAAKGKASMEATRAFLEVMDGLFEQQRPFALINDMREMKVPEVEVRRALGEYQSERKDDFTKYLAADAHVIGNPLLRGLITVINWFSAPEHPQGFFKNIDEAEGWCRHKLDTAE